MYWLKNGSYIDLSCRCSSWKSVFVKSTYRQSPVEMHCYSHFVDHFHEAFVIVDEYSNRTHDWRISLFVCQFRVSENTIISKEEARRAKDGLRMIMVKIFKCFGKLISFTRSFELMEIFLSQHEQLFFKQKRKDSDSLDEVVEVGEHSLARLTLWYPLRFSWSCRSMEWIPSQLFTKNCSIDPTYWWNTRIEIESGHCSTVVLDDHFSIVTLSTQRKEQQTILGITSTPVHEQSQHFDCFTHSLSATNMSTC